MQPFISVTERAAPFPRANIDTDAIIPVIYMRGATKDVSKGLFGLWRHDAAGNPRPDFVLNQPRYRSAKIIVAGANFGCGSSREAAVWALTYSGFRCVIAPSFGEIFYGNALKNGLLPAVVSDDAAAHLLDYAQSAADPLLTVDLGAQKIRMPGGGAVPLVIAEARKSDLLAGRDEIESSLMFADRLAEFQSRDRMERPWLYIRAPVGPNASGR